MGCAKSELFDVVLVGVVLEPLLVAEIKPQSQAPGT